MVAPNLTRETAAQRSAILTVENYLIELDLTDGNDAPAVGADVDAAKALLEGKTPSVRIRYVPTDVVAADMFAEIAGMAQRAGISVRPAGDGDKADAALVSSDVHGTLFANASALVAKGAGGAAAVAAVAKVDERSDPEEVVTAARAVDRELFASHYGLPLVARTGAVAASK